MPTGFKDSVLKKKSFKVLSSVLLLLNEELLILPVVAIPGPYGALTLSDPSIGPSISSQLFVSIVSVFQYFEIIIFCKRRSKHLSIELFTIKSK